MKKFDVIWNAGIALHRGPVDGVQLLNVTASCLVSNDGGPVEITNDLMATNALTFTAGEINEEVDSLELVSLHWSAMPYVDADALG